MFKTTYVFLYVIFSVAVAAINLTGCNQPSQSNSTSNEEIAASDPSNATSNQNGQNSDPESNNPAHSDAVSTNDLPPEWPFPYRDFVKNVRPDSAIQQQLWKSIRVYQIKKWIPGQVAKLPTPSNTFGLRISHHSNLQPGLTDLALKELVKHRDKLEYLELDCSAVTDLGVGAIAQLSNLRALKLSSTSIGNKGIAKLKVLNKLESLEIEKTKFDSNGINHLLEFKELKTLALPNVDSRCVELLVKGSRLHVLSKRHGVMFEREIDGVRPASDSDISRLDVSRIEMSRTAIESLTALKILSRLKLAGEQFGKTKKGAPSPSRSTKKEIKSSSLDAVPGLTQLKELHLLVGSSHLTAELGSSLTHLNSMILESDRVEGLEGLSQIVNLKSFKLAAKQFETEHLTQIANCKKLESVDITRKLIRDTKSPFYEDEGISASYAPLTTMKNLRHVKIYDRGAYDYWKGRDSPRLYSMRRKESPVRELLREFSRMPNLETLMTTPSDLDYYSSSDVRKPNPHAAELFLAMPKLKQTNLHWQRSHEDIEKFLDAGRWPFDFHHPSDGKTSSVTSFKLSEILFGGDTQTLSRLKKLPNLKELVISHFREENLRFLIENNLLHLMRPKIAFNAQGEACGRGEKMVGLDTTGTNITSDLFASKLLSNIEWAKLSAPTLDASVFFHLADYTNLKCLILDAPDFPKAAKQFMATKPDILVCLAKKTRFSSLDSKFRDYIERNGLKRHFR